MAETYFVLQPLRLLLRLERHEAVALADARPVDDDLGGLDVAVRGKHATQFRFGCVATVFVVFVGNRQVLSIQHDSMRVCPINVPDSAHEYAIRNQCPVLGHRQRRLQLTSSIRNRHIVHVDDGVGYCTVDGVVLVHVVIWQVGTVTVWLAVVYTSGYLRAIREQKQTNKHKTHMVERGHFYVSGDSAQTLSLRLTSKIPCAYIYTCQRIRNHLA